MIDPYKIVIEKLESITELTDKVGNRIYEDKVDRHPVRAPLVIIQRIDGVGSYKGIMALPQFQIRVSAEEPEEARQIKRILLAELMEFSGTINGTWTRFQILGDGMFSGDGYWNSTVDVQIKYKE